MKSSDPMNRPDAAYSARVRYTEKNAEAYQERNPRRHRSEMRLIARTFSHVPKGTVLDIPSGGGRVGLFLSQCGYQVTCADYSPAMVDITRRLAAETSAPISVDRQDIESLTYGDDAFDTVVCFRLFHHFPDRVIRERAVRELCRVARQRVALSYFSPIAYSSLRREVRGIFKKRQSKYATFLAEVRGYFEACGFHLERDFAQTPFVRALHIGLFRASDAK